MNKEFLFEIAKIIDNEFIGKEQTFTADRYNNEYWYLNTNVCDLACFIRVYEKNGIISNIKICGEFTDGWQDVSDFTMGRIIGHININKIPVAIL